MKVRVEYSIPVSKVVEIDDKFLVLTKEDEVDLLSYGDLCKLEREMYFEVAERIDGNIFYILDEETDEVLYEG